MRVGRSEKKDSLLDVSEKSGLVMDLKGSQSGWC